MSVQIACEALGSGQRLQLQYKGADRVVEVHAVGFSSKDVALMRVWQVRGGSSGSAGVGWKLLHLDDCIAMDILNEQSEAPRAGYTKGDRAMQRIVCEA